MSEFINNVSRRKEMLKNILRGLHEGRPFEAVRAEFEALVKIADASEIAEVEQMLIEEGLPAAEIQKLCDVHVAVVRESLDRQPTQDTIPGHPVFTFRSENQVAATLLNRLDAALTIPGGDAWQAALALTEQLTIFDRHYLRKENLLFPFLEKYKFTGPSQVMWGIHDEVRANWKKLIAMLQAGPGADETASLKNVREVFGAIRTAMQDMFYKEEKILFPASLEHLTESDWVEIYRQEPELGYFVVRPGSDWKPKAPAPASSPAPAASPEMPLSAAEIPLSTGLLTAEQINLMLTHLPVDVTFVDENDRVRFFSQTKERIFERQPAIIGRKVQNCHPPQSVDKVQKILEDFRAGKRDVAEFWIEMMGKFIHIRYFALRDAQGNYRGTIEVSQDVAAIRALQGERRLLDD